MAKDMDDPSKASARIIALPYGSVKEQSPAVYADQIDVKRLTGLIYRFPPEK